MIPTIDGKMHHFLNVGLYDGLFIMQDTETDTLWNHITGEAVYGELAGHRMPVSNLLQMNVEQALAMTPDIPVAISDRPIGRRIGAAMSPDNPNARLSEDFSVTLGNEDARRPRMELGLGVWSDASRKYYSMDALRENDRIIIDEFDGKSLLIFLDPSSSTPTAMFVDASDARIDGRDVVLDNGQVIRLGQLLNADATPAPAERPQQIFTRWYGYSLTFPGSDIYGE